MYMGLLRSLERFSWSLEGPSLKAWRARGAFMWPRDRAWRPAERRISVHVATPVSLGVTLGCLQGRFGLLRGPFVAYLGDLGGTYGYPWDAFPGTVQ